MTTIGDQNIHTIALEGTFDDCQNLLKGLFNNHAFRDGLRLSGVNSINWARVLAQTVYYFTSAVALGAPHRPVSFTVPTGNFGDILAGYIAKRMGLPIDRLVIATNENDILARTLDQGVYELHSVTPTSSPSMDIQVSSNFERLMFDAYDRNADAIRRLMDQLKQSGRFTLEANALARIRSEFDAARTGEIGTVKEMSRVWSEAGYLIDPHTAVAVHAARKNLEKNPSVPMIALSTAHPAKFGDAVKKAVGHAAPLPEHLSDLMGRKEHFTVLPNDQGTIERFVRERARAARG
jgi:threonine synthase